MQHDDDDEKGVFARLKIAKDRRGLWEGLFDECFSYTMPNRERFYGQSNPGQRDDDQIYDETAVHGCLEFASRLQAGLCPTFQKFIELKAGRLMGDKDKRKQLNLQLNDVSDFIFEIIQDSNFATEIHESFLDLSVSTGCLGVFDGDEYSPVVFRAIPMTRLWFDEGPDGKPGAIFFRDEVKACELKYAWPGVKLDEDMNELVKNKPHEKIEVIYSVVRDYSERSAERWNEYLLYEKDKKILREKTHTGRGSCPLIVFRWMVAAHEIWGRGPVVSSLSGIKTTNLTLQFVLENAAMSIAGMWQTDDDLVLNTDTVELVPGAIIPRRAGRTGLQPLQPGGNFNVADIVLGDQRENIRRGLHADLLGNGGKTPVSATEVIDQRAEEGRRMGSAFGRLQSELIIPLTRRLIFILKERGLIDLSGVKEGALSIRSNSPLSQAQAAQDVQNWGNFYQMVGGLMGQQVLQAAIKQPEMITDLAEKWNVPERQLRSVAELQQMMEAMQQAMQQQGVQPEADPRQGPQELNAPA